MNFIKRQFAIVVMILMGFLSLSGYFVNWDSLRDFTDKDATNFYMIIAGFAAFLGCLNLIQLHLQKIVNKKENWQYSIFTLSGFFVMILFGFIYNGYPNEDFTDQLNGVYDEGEPFIDLNNDGIWNPNEEFTDELNGVYDEGEPFVDLNDNSERDYVAMGPHLKNPNSAFYWMYNYFYLPLGSTMFALLAFFVASASYRAFRIRNFEATLLLISGVLLMLGRVPIGSLIPWWIVIFIYISILFSIIASKISNKKLFFILFIFSNIFIMSIVNFFQLNSSPFLSIPNIQEWIMAVPATAGSRAIMIGIALGIIAQSFRIITGRERSILGD